MVKYVELAGSLAPRAERADLCQRLPVEDHDAGVAEIGHVQEPLPPVRREGEARRCLSRLRTATDRDLLAVAAVEREDLHPFVAPIGNIDLTVGRHLDAV